MSHKCRTSTSVERLSTEVEVQIFLIMGHVPPVAFLGAGTMFTRRGCCSTEQD